MAAALLFVKYICDDKRWKAPREETGQTQRGLGIDVGFACDGFLTYKRNIQIKLLVGCLIIGHCMGLLITTYYY